MADMQFVDWARLDELRTDIGEDAFAEVAALFVAEITEHLDRLAADPGAATVADFHLLRGSAANLGFAAMVAACSAAEAACHADAAPDLARVISGFRGALSEAQAQFPELQAA